MPQAAPIPRFLSAQVDFPRVEEVRERFAIFSQQRSGSTWLGAKLTNLGQFGWIHEYLNEPYMRILIERLGVTPAPQGGIPIGRYLRAVEQVRTSPNGCFGIKIQPNQLQQLVGDDRAKASRILARFDRVIMLTRDDKIAQAVSGAMSEATGNWVYRGGKDHDLSNVPLEALLRDAVSKLYRYTHEEETMKNLCRESGRPWMHLTYEQLVADTDGNLDRVVRFLGHEKGLASLSKSRLEWEPEPPPGKVGADIRRRFLLYIEGRRAEALAT